MDRSRSSSRIELRAVRVPSGGPLQYLLRAEHDRVGEEPGADAPHRRAVPADAIYASPRVTWWLNQQGYRVNPKRVARLMRVMGLQATLPGPHTSRPHPERDFYPLFFCQSQSYALAFSLPESGSAGAKIAVAMRSTTLLVWASER